MKTIIFLAMILMTATTTVYAKMGSEGVGGGAGVKKNGVYKTFYSAGLYVEPTYVDAEEIPGLSETIESISNMEFLSISTKALLINALVPGENRQYFIAKPEGLTKEIHTKLLEEFSKATGENPDNINLFGLTDKKQRITYLLPDFFQLETLNERQAALLHEALWIARPNFKYSDIIQTEMAFQAILENPNNNGAIIDFATRVSEKKEDLVIAALYQDKKTNALKGFLDAKGLVSMKKLLGADFFDCVAEENVALYYVLMGLFSANSKKNCSALAKNYLFNLSNVYKKSLIIKTMLRSFDQDTYLNMNDPRFFEVESSSVTAAGEKMDDYIKVEIWEKLNALEFLAANDYPRLAYLSGAFLQNCSINFNMLSLKQNNLTCPDMGGIKNIKGNFRFGASVPRK